jgi:hypothetical protein
MRSRLSTPLVPIQQRQLAMREPVRSDLMPSRHGVAQEVALVWLADLSRDDKQGGPDAGAIEEFQRARQSPVEDRITSESPLPAMGREYLGNTIKVEVDCRKPVLASRREACLHQRAHTLRATIPR